MQKKIFYWSPCLNKVGTVNSTINSAISLKKYSQSKFKPLIINSCGEWDEYKNLFSKFNIDVIDLYKINYFTILPKRGFIQSRFSYILIFILSFIPLLKLIRNNKDSVFIAHLITSLPLFLFNIFQFESNLILRISGMPKLNFIRKKFWNLSSLNISLITCPSFELLSKLKSKNIFEENRLFFLPDAIFRLDDFIKRKNLSELKNLPVKKKIILSIGRLTKQKNFKYLVNEFSLFNKHNDDYCLCILGDGEEKKEIQKLIISKNLSKKVFLLGHIKNVYNYIKRSEVFILSSLWEDPGFVLIEAGLGNLFVISSDCPNGPKEILNNGINGILYKSNCLNSLSNSLVEYTTLNESTKLSKKLKLKKNIKKYSMFNHFNIIRNLLN